VKEALIAKRYADAFMVWTKGTVGREAAVADFKNLSRVLFDNPDFFHFLANSGFTAAEKGSLVDRALEKGFTQELRLFLKYLIAKRRIDILPWIVDYVRENYAHGASVTAVLTSSYPLDLDIMTNVKARLEKKFQKRFTMYTELDPDLKGGLQIAIGSTLIDGSIRRRLDDLRAKLKTCEVDLDGN
jgi:F-type H+-transporting ATPase subunit delta